MEESQTVKDPQPNLEDLQCRGTIKIGQNASISLTAMHLEWGKWGTNPPASLTGPSNANWMAQGRLASSSGAEGGIAYTTPDDAEFTLSFDVPYSGTNTAEMTCKGKGCSLYTFSVTQVPPGGSVITPVYEIVKK
jgi:hypothetical protein